MATTEFKQLYNNEKFSDLTVFAEGGFRFPAHKLVVFNFPGVQRVAGADTNVLQLAETAPNVSRMLRWMYGNEWAGFANTPTVVAVSHLFDLAAAAEKVWIAFRSALWRTAC